MVAKYDVYKCEECGNVTMMLHSSGVPLVCCGKDMVEQIEQTADSSQEKHVPLIEKTDGGYDVTVGSTLHPMLDAHWIQWVELVVDGNRMLRELNPGDEPKVHFCYDCAKDAQSVTAREYCNLHGLWRGEL